MFAPLISALFFAASANAAIGPVADLHIVNANIAPDGYNRMYVLCTKDFKPAI